jgi:hypothetical protein
MLREVSMPNLNIPISEDLLLAINIAALRARVRQKEWVISVLSQVVGAEDQRYFTAKESTADAVDADPKLMGHDSKTCRVYKCGRCAALNSPPS